MSTVAKSIFIFNIQNSTNFFTIKNEIAESWEPSIEHLRSAKRTQLVWDDYSIMFTIITNYISNPKDRSKYKWIVAVDVDRRLLGLLSYRPLKSNIFVFSILTNPEYHRWFKPTDRQIKGIGTCLLLTLAQKYPEAQIELDSLESCLTFYESLGFKRKIAYPERKIKGVPEKLAANSETILKKGVAYTNSFEAISSELDIESSSPVKKAS